MSWTQKLFGISSLQPSRTRLSTQAEIVACHAALLEGAQRLSEHAGMAPGTSPEAALRRLSECAQQLAADLRRALREVGVVVSTKTDPLPPPEGMNHWARLRRDLEHHSSLADRVLHAAIAAEEVMPQVAGTLHQVVSGLDEILRGLRDLIARADPQALD